MLHACIADKAPTLVLDLDGDSALAEHRMGRNYFAHHAGDAVNAVLAAAGYNFHLLLKWLELLLLTTLVAPKAAAAPHHG
jgi:IS5 family transposase